MFCFNPVDTQFRFNVHSTSMQRQINAETTSCACSEGDLIFVSSAKFRQTFVVCTQI